MTLRLLVVIVGAFAAASLAAISCSAPPVTIPTPGEVESQDSVGTEILADAALSP